MNYLLGIDVGTTGTKCAIFSADGELIDLSSRDYGLQYPREGWVEQEPGDWWNAVIETVKDVTAPGKRGKATVAMSLSTQGGALVLLDKDFNALYGAVSWLDTRAKETSEQLTEKIGAAELYRMCGWPILNGLNFPTIFWFKEKRPYIFKRASFFASTIDYMNYLLTNRFSIDYSNLALTMFLDLDKRDLSDRALRIAGIKRENVPEVIPSGRVIGTLTPKAADLLGLPEDVVVVSGAHDQYCASIGAGAINTGDCILSAGTAWVLLATCDELYFIEDSLISHSIARAVFPGLHPAEGKYGLMTAVPFGGNSLKWFHDVMRPDLTYDQLSRDASEVPAGSDGLLFVPISSSVTGRGAFLGIDGVHGASHFTRAVLEGVSFLNKRHLGLIQEAGVTVSNLIMIGGGSKSLLWPKIVADVCNIPVILPDMKEAACAGAAVLAGAGSGVFSSLEEAAKRITGKKSTVTPNSKNVGVYEKQYEKFSSYLECV